MILDLHQLLLLGILCATIHWIIARSKITRWFWSRATGWLAAWLACAGCFGTWVGTALGIAGLRPVSLCYFDEITLWTTVSEVAVAGLLGTFLTPVFEGVLLWGLERSAIEEQGDHAAHPGLFDDVDRG